MKTVSSLKQNFFACLPAIAGREASPVLEKPGGLRGDSLVVWLPGDTKQGGAALPPGGWGGSQKRAFSSVKRLIFVAGELWPGIDLQVECPNTSRPDTRKVLFMYFKQAGIVFSTVFINPDIYIFRAKQRLLFMYFKLIPI